MISRRDFLKMLGVASGAAVVGLPVPSAAPSLDLLPAELVLLDAPVTRHTPFAWFWIDGREYAAMDIGMYMETIDVTGFGDAFYSYVPTRVTLTPTIFGMIDIDPVFDLRAHDFEFGWHSRRYQSRGYIAEFSAERNLFHGIVSLLEIHLSAPVTPL